MVMVGNGVIGEQPLGAYPTLPTASFTASPSASSLAAAASASLKVVQNAKDESSAAWAPVVDARLVAILAAAAFGVLL
jgi:hypothetical protein